MLKLELEANAIKFIVVKETINELRRKPTDNNKKAR